MAKQLIKNRGFENGLTDFFTQGTVADYGDIAYSGIKSALLLSSPTSMAEISQVVLSIRPGAPVKFSLFTRKFTSKDATNASDIWAEVNFLSLLGTIIQPGIFIGVRGGDLEQNVWYCYEEYGTVPLGTAAAQVIIRLAPPVHGTSGILIDDLTLVSDLVASAEQPPTAPILPA